MIDEESEEDKRMSRAGLSDETLIQVAKKAYCIAMQK